MGARDTCWLRGTYAITFFFFGNLDYNNSISIMKKPQLTNQARKMGLVCSEVRFWNLSAIVLSLPLMFQTKIPPDVQKGYSSSHQSIQSLTRHRLQYLLLRALTSRAFVPSATWQHCEDGGVECKSTLEITGKPVRNNN